MVKSEGQVRVNQVPPVTQRLQQGQKDGVRLTGNSQVFQPMESIQSWKHSEVLKVV